LSGTLKVNNQIAYRINKRVNELRDKGITGVEFKKESYKVKIEEERRYKEVKYQKATIEVKRKIREQAMSSGSLNNFMKIKNRTQLYMLIQTKQKLVEIANTTNMFELIFENLQKFNIDEIRLCELIKDNEAWISRSDSGMYRYFTRQPNGITTGLSIFDLLEIIDGIEGFQYTQEELARLLDLNQLRDVWIINEERKYQNNLEIFENEEVILRKNYPSMYGFINMEILKFINHFGYQKVNRLFMHQNEHVISISTTFIAKEMKTVQSAVSREINLLVFLGLIRKVPHSELSSELMKIALELRQNSNANFHLISFYQLPNYLNKEVMRSAEVWAEKLLSFNIRSSRDITKEKLIKNFGLDKACEVYLPKAKMKDIFSGESSDDDIPF